ncbi:MAG: type II toxin-antitoxin system PemK/MazF family toxin [Anaerolineae bacterium]|nr:type II toxin-antitoxin system PemK/MazF family toxin [Anaerolineae bacterium]
MAEPRIIQPGDIYWLRRETPGGVEADIPHPYVVLREPDPQTVLVCALTSNMKRLAWPGNLLLEAGEANLPRPSMVEVSKVSTLAKTELGDYIGSLDERRIQQIVAGIRFLQTSYFDRE